MRRQKRHRWHPICRVALIKGFLSIDKDNTRRFDDGIVFKVAETNALARAWLKADGWKPLRQCKNLFYKGDCYIRLDKLGKDDYIHRKSETHYDREP